MASAAAAAVQPLDRTRARRKAAWRRRRLVLLLMAPWLIGFSVFFGYPLVMSVYLSFTHYDLLSSPKWIGTANYRYLFTQDPQVGDAVKNTLWIIAVMVPLQVIFAFGVATDARACAARRGLLPDDLLPAGAGAAGGRDPRVRLHPQPRDGPGEHSAQAHRDRGTAVVPVSWLVEALARDARPVGRREHHDHLSRRHPRRAEAPVRVGRAGRGRAVATDALGDVADDKSRDPVLGRDRRHRRAPVLHAGLRRRQRRLRPGLAGGRPDGEQPWLPGRRRRSSIPCCSTSTASVISTWATPLRCRCCCSSSRSPSQSSSSATRAAGCTTWGRQSERDDRSRRPYAHEAKAARECTATPVPAGRRESLTADRGGGRFPRAVRVHRRSPR